MQLDLQDVAECVTAGFKREACFATLFRENPLRVSHGVLVLLQVLLHLRNFRARSWSGYAVPMGRQADTGMCLLALAVSLTNLHV